MTRKTLTTPPRTYSGSWRAGRPGATGSGRGCRPAVGDWFRPGRPAAASDRRAVIDVEHILHVPDEIGIGSGGMHHCSFSHGLRSFAQRSAAPSRTRRPRPPPGAPVHRPAAAASSAPARPAARCRRGRSDGPRRPRRARARRPDPGACAPARPPAPVSTTGGGTRATVAGWTSRARQWPHRVQPGPPSLWSALSRMRAWVSMRAGAVPCPIERAQLGTLRLGQHHGILGLAHAGSPAGCSSRRAAQPTDLRIYPSQISRDGALGGVVLPCWTCTGPSGRRGRGVGHRGG